MMVGARTRFVVLYEVLLIQLWGFCIWLSGWTPVRGGIALILFMVYLCTCIIAGVVGIQTADTLKEREQ